MVSPQLSDDVLQIPIQLPPEYAGYHPRRDDYEHEQNNDAEQYIKDIIIYDDDLEYVKDLKLAMLEMYNRKLDKRMRCRELAKKLRLNDTHARAPFVGNSEYEAFRLRMRPFVQYSSSVDSHQELLELFHTAQQQKLEIQRLQHLRRNGVRTWKDAAKYERDKQEREQKDKAIKKPTGAARAKARKASLLELPLGNALSRPEQEVREHD